MSCMSIRLCRLSSCLHGHQAEQTLIKALSQVYTGWFGKSSPSILGGTGAENLVSILVAYLISTVFEGLCMGHWAIVCEMMHVTHTQACTLGLHKASLTPCATRRSIMLRKIYLSRKDAKHNTACRRTFLNGSAMRASTGRIAICIGLTILLTTVASWLHATPKDCFTVAREQIGEDGRLVLQTCQHDVC